jgi:hypothetical protein
MDFPFSARDIARAFRESIKIFDDVAKRSGRVVKFYLARGRKKAAKNLDYLRFHEAGMVKQLRMIASGDFSAEDVGALKGEFRNTAQDVSDAIKVLRAYRDAIREQLSLETAIVLEEIIDGENGKSTIRSFLDRMSYASVDLGNENYKKWMQENALRSIRKIDIMNANIIELHNSLLEGKKIRKRAGKEEEKVAPLKREVPKAKKTVVKKRKTVAKKKAKRRKRSAKS